MNITLCIGRPTIDKAASGEPVDMGHGVTILAADGLHRNSPYDTLKNIATQKTTDELKAEGEQEYEDADFEGAYDALIHICRRALESSGAPTL